MLSALTMLMGCSLCNLQHLSQLSHLTSLGISSSEQGISTLVKLEHLSVRATQLLDRHQRIGANTEDSSPCLAMLPRLASLDCSSIHWQQIPNLIALTSLTALTVFVSNILTFNDDSRSIWSSLSKLPLLVNVDIAEAVLFRTDFLTVALMTQMTKQLLHFCGYGDDLQFLAEDINKLSVLTSLQYLHLGLNSSGTWSDVKGRIKHKLEQLHNINTRNMQYFKVVQREVQEYDDSDSGSDICSHLDSDSYE